MADLNDDLTTRGTKNSVEGKTDDLKGKAKDAWGGATGNTSEQLEGKADQLKGKAKDALGKSERDLDK
ncbi:MAG: CsbD family protein [Gemmatimonadaceae bacterium]